MRRIYSKTGKSVLLLLFLEENSCLLCLSVQTPCEFLRGGGHTIEGKEWKKAL